MELLWKSFEFVWYTTPIWLPLLAAFIAWEMWVDYTRTKFRQSNKRILLEIKLPQVIDKSPLAMELILTALHITGRESTFVDRYFKGKSRPQFSLEMVSIGGTVRFFIWTEEGYKNIIEAQIYAQYPNVEVFEVEDYTKGIVFDPTKNQIWATEFIKSKDSTLPIKTYVDYGLDQNPDEEFKIDPLTATLEFLGAIKEGQQVWIQMIIRAHKKETRILDKKTGRYKKVDWEYFADIEKNKILDKLKEKPKDEKSSGSSRRATKGEEQIISAIEHNTSKLAFDVGIRALYFESDKAKYNPLMIAGTMGSIRQYNSNNLNALKPENTTSFDYPWQDFREKRLNKKRAHMLSYFKRRAFFNLSHRKAFVMSTEELATMFHFPGGVASTPTFSRIMSKKSEPPANLPI